VWPDYPVLARPYTRWNNADASRIITPPEDRRVVMNVHLHMPHPHLHDMHVPRHMHPAAVVGIVALAWLVLVAATSALWEYGFGFDGSESVALSVGLFAYIAAVVAVMGIVAFAVTHDHR
jgi:hypothetical protein